MLIVKRRLVEAGQTLLRIDGLDKQSFLDVRVTKENDFRYWLRRVESLTKCGASTKMFFKVNVPNSRFGDKTSVDFFFRHFAVCCSPDVSAFVRRL